MIDTDIVERVAEAIEGVQFFSRINDWASNDWASDAVKGWPVEICRYGDGDEPEIVVVRRYPTGMDESEALREIVREERAKAAIAVLRGRHLTND